MNEACHAYECVMSRMSHTCMRDRRQWVMPPLRFVLNTRPPHSRRIEGAWLIDVYHACTIGLDLLIQSESIAADTLNLPKSMAHCLESCSYIIYINESCHVWKSHATYVNQLYSHLPNISADILHLPNTGANIWEQTGAEMCWCCVWEMDHGYATWW